MSKCIITGCRFVIPAEGKSVWGDLHSVSDEIVVFNGITAPCNFSVVSRQARWEYAYPSPDKDERQVILNSGADYYEHRGIITCCQRDVWLNDVAMKYLGDC